MTEAQIEKEIQPLHSVQRWLQEARPEQLIRDYLEKQKAIFALASNGKADYAPTTNPDKRQICEMTVCEVCRSLVPPPEGFAPISDKKAIIYDHEGKTPLRAVNHMFYYNEKQDLVLCLSPGQFVDDLIGNLAGTRMDRKGFRISVLMEMAKRSNIQFIESPNEEGNFVMMGSPQEIKSVLGLDFFGEDVSKSAQYPSFKIGDNTI